MQRIIRRYPTVRVAVIVRFCHPMVDGRVRNGREEAMPDHFETADDYETWNEDGVCCFVASLGTDVQEVDVDF